MFIMVNCIVSTVTTPKTSVHQINIHDQESQQEVENCHFSKAKKVDYSFRQLVFMLIFIFFSVVCLVANGKIFPNRFIIAAGAYLQSSVIFHLRLFRKEP